eukprot:1162065-Pelagomonas_calceolata.AAC.13
MDVPYYPAMSSCPAATHICQEEERRGRSESCVLPRGPRGLLSCICEKYFLSCNGAPERANPFTSVLVGATMLRPRSCAHQSYAACMIPSCFVLGLAALSYANPECSFVSLTAISLSALSA